MYSALASHSKPPVDKPLWEQAFNLLMVKMLERSSAVLRASAPAIPAAASPAHCGWFLRTGNHTFKQATWRTPPPPPFSPSSDSLFDDWNQGLFCSQMATHVPIVIQATRCADGAQSAYWCWLRECEWQFCQSAGRVTEKVSDYYRQADHPLFYKASAGDSSQAQTPTPVCHICTTTCMSLLTHLQLEPDGNLINQRTISNRACHDIF